MSRIYDNWERLVAATLKRDQIWQLCHAHSREPSISSQASDFSFPSPLPNALFDSSSSRQNSVSGAGTSRWGYESSDFEVEKIVKTENPHVSVPEEIFVNGEPLSQEELTVLWCCQHPPKTLKQGYYWYDKVSGFWGKQGQKPSQIISPYLNVGGHLNERASNGNTQVYMNGREITKVELRMLKFAGVRCRPDTRIWIEKDGSYQYEGQNNTAGCIWDKAIMKLLCSLLSLPFPPKSSYASGEQSVPENLEQNDCQKLLLIGCNGSGTSTILNQAKFLYKDIPFLEDELQHVKLLIQRNTIHYICLILEGRIKFEEENLIELKKYESFDEFLLTGHTDGNGEETVYSLCPRLKVFSDWLLKIMPSGMFEEIFPAASREYAPLFEELWSSAAFQATYKRRTELGTLPSVASYFLDEAVEILKPDYKPSDVDILYAEHATSSNGLSCVDFSFPESAYDDDGADSWNLPDSLSRYQLIRLQAKGFAENHKWLQMFEDVRIVIFCVSLSDYDQFAVDGDGTLLNKMLLSKKFFENMVTHPTFDQIDFLLLLNRFDSFEEKIQQVPLSRCDWFDDFHSVMSRNLFNHININRNNAYHPTLAQLGFHYITVKFKRLFSALTGRNLYVSRVTGLEPYSVDAALKYAREILKWDELRPNFSLSEYSTCSSETSSFSD